MAKLQSVNSVAGKETIYVDVDDEITTVIDKVQAAKGKVVALVLPKRATVLQSIVNMKLLKRTADTSGKNLVLVTSETGLMPLAGAVGLYVASTPSSKPTIPPAPASPGDEPEDVDEPLDMGGSDTAEDAEEYDAKAAAGKTVGELAAAGATGKLASDDIDESIDMTDDAGDTAGAGAAAASKTLKPKKNSKLKVPNFDSFRKKIALGVLAVVALIALWIFALVVLPHAKITIHTDSATIPTNLNLTLSADAKKLDTDNGVVPATAQSQQKTSTQQVPSTGTQNNGTKASGTVTVQNCTADNNEVSLPAGKSITANGHTYTLNNSVDLPLSGHQSNGTCKSINGITIASVGVSALKGGADYNLPSGTAFTVSSAGDGSYSSSEVKISGSTTGGTDQIVKIVTATDIAGATSKITAADSGSVKQQLVSGIQAKGLQPVSTTFVAGTPAVTTSAKAGDTADTVTVTAVTAYTMLGVQKSDLQSLVKKNVEGQLDKGKQVILDDGVANAKFTQANPATATGASVSMEAKSEVGPQIDVNALKTQLAGKKSGDVKSYIKQTPGVTDVDVHYSPFWVNSVPKKAGKVTITIVKSGN